MHARFLTVVLMAVALPMMAGCAAMQPKTDLQRAEATLAGARSALQVMLSSTDAPLQRFQSLLPRAEGVVILPGVIKGGFVVAVEGGNGVMLAKDASGQWNGPAFYFLAAGSVGLQAGGQATDVVLLLFSQDAVRAVIDHQGKLGADLGLVIGTVGSGVEAATTTNIGADILAFSHGVGAFAGGSLEASALVKRNDFNAAFYGQPMEPTDILLGGGVPDTRADGLRALLNGQ